MTNLTRRGFIGGVAATCAVVALPFAAEAKPYVFRDITVDLASKSITLHKPMTGVELYRCIKNAWLDDEHLMTHSFPMVRCTDELIESTNDWGVREVHHLKECSLIQKDPTNYTVVDLGEYL
jgi:hypothetical protein